MFFCAPRDISLTNKQLLLKLTAEVTDCVYFRELSQVSHPCCCTCLLPESCLTLLLVSLVLRNRAYLPGVLICF